MQTFTIAEQVFEQLAGALVAWLLGLAIRAMRRPPAPRRTLAVVVRDEEPVVVTIVDERGEVLLVVVLSRTSPS